MLSRQLPLTAALLGFAALLPAQNQKDKLAMPGDVDVTPDIVYANYGDKQLRLDLYLPKNRTGKPIPGVVVIRGGGWRVGDKQGFAPIAANLAASGLAAACIEYRVLPDVKFPDPVYDTKAAVRWMRAEGKRYSIATDAIGVIGGSAGGHLVALLGTSYKVSTLEGGGGHPGVSSRVQAVVAMAPVVDFVSMSEARSGGSDMVKTLFGDRPELAALLAPVTHLDKDSAPILLIHSNADKTVPHQQSEEMLARCKKIGVPASLITIEGAPHGFWMQPQWAANTVKQSAEFFHSVLDRLVPAKEITNE